MITKVNVKITTGLIFALGLGILLAIGWLTYQNTISAAAAAREVDHTNLVLHTTDDIFSSLKDAEAAQRGFVITGVAEYLKSYTKATDDVLRTLSVLDTMTRNNERQQHAIAGIETAVRDKLETMKKTIEIRRTRGQTAAVRAVETGIGEKQIEDIRARVAAVRAQETGLLKKRSIERSNADRRLIETIVGGDLLGFSLLLTAFFFLEKEIHRRVKIEENLRIHQERLEELVEERTRDLATANSRLQEENLMRRHAEEDLKRSLDAVARSNQELDQFASIASHDLRAPLRSISGFISLLESRYKGRLDQKADQWIDFTVKSAKRMSDLISDLYVYSRVGSHGKEFQSLDLNHILSSAVENLKESIDENKAVIQHDPLPRALGDETQLVQLFQNLLANAIKFRKKEEGPVIRISAQVQNGESVIGVHDNGIGIEADYFKRIFEIFQRLHTPEEYPGTGLGLALCRKIVDRHGGRIWVDSIPGKGSSFYFTIPAQEHDN